MASRPQTWREADNDAVSSPVIFDWILKRGRICWELLEYSSAYLAILAAIEVIIVLEILSLPLTPAPIVVGLITFTIYANDRLVDLDSDAVSNPERTKFARQYKTHLYVLAAIAYGLAVAISVLGGPFAFGITLLPGVAWIFYAVNWVPTINIPFQRLKEILVINSAIVAVTWSFTIVFLPITFVDAAITPSTWVVFWYLTLGTFACTEISNVRDIESDIENGVATLPVTVGVHQTRYLLYGISLLMAVMVVYALSTGYLTAISAGSLFAGLVSLVAIISLVGRTKHERFLSVAGECSRLPVFAVIVAASII